MQFTIYKNNANKQWLCLQEELEQLRAKVEKLEQEQTHLKHDNDRLEAKVSSLHFMVWAVLPSTVGLALVKTKQSHTLYMTVKF
jgi:predicted nuclease with TOPRIM domain